MEPFGKQIKNCSETVCQNVVDAQTQTQTQTQPHRHRQCAAAGAAAQNARRMRAISTARSAIVPCALKTRMPKLVLLGINQMP